MYMSDIVLFHLFSCWFCKPKYNFGCLAAVKCGRQVNPDTFLKSGAPKMDGRVDPPAGPGCGEGSNSGDILTSLTDN